MIRVLLFGPLAKIAGRREIDIELEEGAYERALSDIVDEVRREYLQGNAGIYMLAINEVQVQLNAVVKDGDEVAIMPPFSGG